MLLANTERNPGVPLQPDWFDAVAVNTPAAERRAASLTTRRTVKKVWQAGWLVNAIRCIDLTTLSGDDTPRRVERLAAKAKADADAPVAAGLALLGVGDIEMPLTPERVWREFASRERMGEWWGKRVGTPEAATAQGQWLDEYEPREGGRIRMSRIAGNTVTQPKHRISGNANVGTGSSFCELSHAVCQDDC